MAKKNAAKTAAPALDKNAARAAKFVELAQKRVTKAINAVRSISSLSNRNNYVYTPEQIAKIGDALKGEVVNCIESFNKTAAAKKEGFTL